MILSAWKSLVARARYSRLRRRRYGRPASIPMLPESLEFRCLLSASSIDPDVVDPEDGEIADPTGLLEYAIDDPRDDEGGSLRGKAVAIDGNYTVVGSPGATVNAAQNVGRVDVYNSSSGALLVTLYNPTPAFGDNFGSSVAIFGNTIVVGAKGDDTGAANAGSVYLFDKTNGTLTRTINNPTPAAGEEFGASVGGTGSTVMIGSPGDQAGGGAGAVYVFNPQTGALIRTLANPTPVAGDRFGESLSVSSNRIAVGAPGDDTSATNAGAAYLFDASSGALRNTLSNPTPAANDKFGSAVAVVSNDVVVGAPGDDTSASDSGAAYLFNSNTGALARTLNNPTPAAGDAFGSAVAAQGSTIVVGAPGDDTGATNSGTAYFFKNSNGALEKTVLNPTPAADDAFGTAVAAHGGKVVVGASGDDTTDIDAGAAYIFHATNGELLKAILTASTQLGDWFGYDVALSGNTLVVGRPQDDAGAVDAGNVFVYDADSGNLRMRLFNPTPAIDEEFGSSLAVEGNLIVVGARNAQGGVGAAYGYNATTGALLFTITNPSPAAGDRFGFDVSIGGGKVVVSAPGDDAGQTDSGAIHVFNASTGAFIRTIANPTPAKSDNFGQAVVVSGNLLAVGAPNDSVVGAVHIYDMTTGARLRTIANPTPANCDHFGGALAAEGSTLVVGARLDDLGATDTGTVFTFDITTGALKKTLKNPAPAREDHFGASVAIADGVVIVGAAYDGRTNNRHGAAHVFDAASGLLLKSIDNPHADGFGGDSAEPCDPSEQFGFAVAASPDFFVVGAPFADEVGEDSGSIFVYSHPVRTGTVKGYVWNDLNANGIRETSMIQGDDPDVVFVIDVSGSTRSTFAGGQAGNINGDSYSNTVLDAEIAGFIALNNRLIAQGLSSTATVSITVFGTSAKSLDMNPNLAGVQLAVSPTADADHNGVRDVEQILKSIRIGHQGVGGWTNYEAALRNVQTVFNSLGTARGDGNMIFLSDGYRTAGGSIADEVNALKAAGHHLRAYGAGDRSKLIPDLVRIDPNAEVFTNTNELLNVFAGLNAGQLVYLEPGLAGVKVYADLNNNGSREASEPFTITRADNPLTTDVNETGWYQLSGVPVGTVTIRQEVPVGFRQTFPAPATAGHTVNVVMGNIVCNVNFGDTLNAVNEPPTTTGLGNVTVLEDAANSTINLWAAFSDPDDADASLAFSVTSNTNPSLFSAVTVNNATGTLVLDYAPNANGTASITVRATDPDGLFVQTTFLVTVTPVNDAPSFVAGPNQSTNEDSGPRVVTNWAGSLSAGPANEASQTLSFEIVGNTNASLFAAGPAIASDGTLTYTPAANAFGTATITVRIRDNGGTANGGVDASATQSFTIAVNSVNDAPSFTAGPNQTVNEDAGAQTVNGWATALSAGPANEASQTLSFEIVSNSNPSLFAVGPTISSTGALSYTPAANAFGTATISVRIRDNGGTANGGVDASAAQSFTIAVSSVNDAPSFTAGPNQTVNEDAGVQTVNGWATALSAGPANEASQTLSFEIVSNSNPGLFAAGPSVSPAGALTYTPAANAFGTASITVRIRDNGGTANGGVDVSATQSFTIGVLSVNDAPSFTGGPNQVVNEDDGPITVTGWASGISAGPANESTQTVTFEIVSNSNPSLFSSGPSLAPNGTLTYTSAPNAFGAASIVIRARDNGGTANGGVDVSATHTLSIVVGSVNDAPSFTVGGNQTVNEDAGAQTVTGWATNISAGPANESTQTVSFEIVGNTNPGLFATGPAVSNTGTLTYTPAANAFGTATISVRLRDNGGGSNLSTTQTFDITVNPVNDAPAFTAGPSQTVNEDAGAQSVAGWATALSAGPANEASQTLSFEVVGNSNPSLFASGPALAPNGTLTYTPAADAFGTASITVRIRDNGGTASGGVDASPTQTFTIAINSVNDAPSFTGGPSQVVNEDDGPITVTGWASGISAGPANESSQTVTFEIVSNSNPSLFSSGPSLAPNGTLTYTSAPNAFGAASIVIRARDNGGTANGGVDVSATHTLSIVVGSVNDAPSFTVGGNQTVNEDAGAQTVTGWATNISAGPANESTQTVSFEIVGNTNPGLFASGPSVASDGTLTYTPAANAFGTATISVRLRDNGGGSNLSTTQTFDITVNPVNDAPSFTAGPTQTVNEDAGPQTVPNYISIFSPGPANESGQTTTFEIVGNTNPSLFAVSPTIAADGTLTYTPAPNAFGTAGITVRIRDNGGTANGGVDVSAPQTMNIVVNSVNDAPSFTAGANQTVNEDAGAQTLTGWATALSAGPANEASQTLSFEIVSNSNPSLFAVAPSVAPNGTLTYTPAANAFGTATVSVRIRDNGGTANGGVDASAPQSFTIAVNSVNDAPSFTAGANQTVNEDAGAQTVAGWATGASAGPSNEASQTLTYEIVSNSNPGLFASGPAVAPDGTLSYTPVANAFGTASVSIRIRDNGGTANGGVNVSATQTFTIAVLSVNDAPSFTPGPNQTVNEDAGPQTVATWATAASAGPANEASQTLTYEIVSNSNPSLFSVQPTITPGVTSGTIGTLRYTPAANAFGTATIQVRLRDNGGTANGGVDVSPIQTFSITVNPVNDAPSFTKGPDITVDEDAGPQSFANWATGISAGPLETQNLTFEIVGNTNAGLFSTQPAVSATGTLSFQSAPLTFGTATITVRLRDDGGTANGGVDVSGTQTFVITVEEVNHAPTPNPGGPYTVGEGASITVNGSATDLDGDAITAYEWDFNYDGVSFQVDATGASASFSAAGIDGPGSRTIALRAHDTFGNVSNPVAQTVTVTNLPPNVAVTNDGAVPINVPVNIIVTATDPAGAADPLLYEYDLDNNGTYEFSSTNNIVTQTYAVGGLYTINVRVSDDDGGVTLGSTIVEVIAPILMDDSEPGVDPRFAELSPLQEYTTTGSTGTNSEGHPGPDGLFDLHFDLPSVNSGAAVASWTSQELPIGLYRVSVTWPSDPNRTPFARYTVTGGVAPSSRTFDQRFEPNIDPTTGLLRPASEWYSFGGTTPGGISYSDTFVDVDGHYRLNSRGQITITLYDDAPFFADGFAIADAVRIEYIGTLPPIDIRVADGAAEVNNAGTLNLGAGTFSGADLQKTLTITNDGLTMPLNLGGITATGPFTVTPPAATTLAPGASTTITVTLPSSFYGTYTGTLTIPSNDPDEAPYTANLTGKIEAVIVDDGDAGFTNLNAAGFAPVGHAGDLRFDAPDASNADIARWTSHVLPAGTYRIGATWLADPNRSNSVTYTITGGANTQTVTYDQKLSPLFNVGLANVVTDRGSDFADLGADFVLTAPGTISVLVHDDAAVGFTIADAIRIEPVLPPQFAVGGQASGPQAPYITAASLQAVFAQAVTDVLATSFGAANAEKLASVTVGVGDLQDGQLGTVWNNEIILDVNAAGYGWFIDSTPADASEFTALSTHTFVADFASNAFGKMDAYSTMVHEIGRLLGLIDVPTTIDNAMSLHLATGTRYTPGAQFSIDDAFASMVGTML